MGSQSVAPYRPSQWNSPGGATPSLTMTAISPQTGQQTAYVFDGTPGAEHTQICEITRNPVQTGAAVTDNAFIEPPQLVVQILMSDSMQSYTIGQWAGSPSRSVNAYQTLLSIQASLAPVQVATRLRQYNNMAITSIVAREDPKTTYSLEATITFTQIITASGAISSGQATFNSPSNSRIPQSTSSTGLGETEPVPVPASITSQNNVDNANPPLKLQQVPDVAAAGNWSSNNSNGLNSVIN